MNRNAIDINAVKETMDVYYYPLQHSSLADWTGTRVRVNPCAAKDQQHVQQCCARPSSLHHNTYLKKFLFFKGPTYHMKEILLQEQGIDTSGYAALQT